STRPAQPRRRPMTRYPSRSARMVMARIAGLSPGTSPPPVRMAMVPFSAIAGTVPNVMRITRQSDCRQRAGLYSAGRMVAMPTLRAPAGLHLADRVAALGTENAFKIGPCIREVEAGGERVIRCNIGEPDFPVPKHIADEVKRQIDLDQTHYC